MTSTSYSTTVPTSLGTRSYRYPGCKCETVMQNFTSHWAAGQREEPLLFGWPADVRNTGHKSHSRWGLGICSMQFLLPLVINLFQISGQPGQPWRVSDWTRQVTTARHRVSLPISISSSMDCGFSWSGPHTTVIIESYHQVVLHKLRKLAPNQINSRHLWRHRLEGNLQDRSTTLCHFLHHVDCSTCLPKDLDTTLQLVCTFGEYTLSH